MESNMRSILQDKLTDISKIYLKINRIVIKDPDNGSGFLGLEER